MRRDLTEAVEQALKAVPHQRIGVAVSGGGDSMALLSLLHEAAGERRIFAATVDHNLRAESAREAQFVKEACGRLGITHDTLVWEGAAAKGNMQSRARDARYELLSRWARKNDIGLVALGHTINDQAETFLMRLARRSGVDGLSGMAEMRSDPDVTWWRPLLRHYREDLRAYLSEREMRWVDDPSNFDTRFERIRMREAMGSLAELGLGPATLAAVAGNLAEARDALQGITQEIAKRAVTGNALELRIDRACLQDSSAEIARRIMSSAIKWVSGNEFGPRRKPLQRILMDESSASEATLNGCCIAVDDACIRISREPAAVANLRTSVDEFWDGRWKFEGPIKGDDLHVASLGAAGLSQCPDWRETGHTRTALMASPGVWKGNDVISAPHAGIAGEFTLKSAPDINDFFTSLISR